MNKFAIAITRKLDKIDPVKSMTFLVRFMAVMFIMMVMLGSYVPAQAGYRQDGEPTVAPTEGSGGSGSVATGISDPTMEIIVVFQRLGEIFINIAYSLMVIVFAVGTVKSGLTAQVSQQFGVAGRASAEVMNLIAGVLIFVVGLLSLPLVKGILKELGQIVHPNLTLQDLPIFTQDSFGS